MQCPCGSHLDYSNCCEPFISGDQLAPTAEALMRSRYTAHVKFAGQYLKETLAPETRGDYDDSAVEEWAKQSEWLGLKILSTKDGHENDSKGVVEFQATYKSQGKVYEHHEVAQFRKDPRTNKWFFVDGEAHTHEEGQGHHDHAEPKAPVTREGPKVGRNDPCTCGSGKKYKKCHGSAA